VKALKTLRQVSASSRRPIQASPAVGGDKKGKEEAKKDEDKPAVREGTIYFCCAELFCGHAERHTGDIWRGIIPGITDGFTDLIKFACQRISNRPNSDKDVLLVSDGRSEHARKQIRSVMTSALGDEGFTEIWVVYNLETAIKADVRNPKRKTVWSAANMEVLFVALPGTRPKTSYSVVHRDLFTAAGESTNFSKTYTGVPFRNLTEIPRLTGDAKQEILGTAAVGAFNKERVTKEVEERQHPLLWGEGKPGIKPGHHKRGTHQNSARRR